MPSTARRPGATCSTPPSRWPTTASTSARGWPPPSPTPHQQLRVDPNASAYFLNPDGSPKTAGTRLTNPAYSKTLGVIASDPQSFYTGDIARAIVAAAADTSGGRTPSLMTVEDLSGYTAKKREPLCTPYRGTEICGMPPPSSGGIAVAATLGMLEHFPMGDHKPTDVDLNGGRPAVMGVHLISEAERLAYADRDKYVADTDFVPLPGGSPNTLLNSDYLAGRAALISEQHTMGTAKPGEFGIPTTPAPPTPEHGTSQISIIDAQGNAASLTTTVESAFGSYPHGGRIHPQQPAHRLRGRAHRPGRRCRCPTGSSRESGRAARWHRRWCSTSPAPSAVSCTRCSARLAAR